MLDSFDDAPTVAEVARRWIALRVTLTRTPQNVLTAIQRVDSFLVPFMGERPIASVKPATLHQYRVWLQDLGRLAPRTVKHVLADCRCMLNWAESVELIAFSPFPRGMMPRIAQTAPDRLTDDEADAVLTIGEPHAFVIRLALGTGLRWSELSRVRPHHLQAGMLLVPQTKSGKVRRVPISEALASEIENSSGRPVPFGILSAGSFNKVVARRSGVARFHVHQLRHTFACRWIERGGSLAALQQILGHASVVTTQLYARLSDDIVRREAERITGNMAAARFSSVDPALPR